MATAEDDPPVEREMALPSTAVLHPPQCAVVTDHTRVTCFWLASFPGPPPHARVWRERRKLGGARELVPSIVSSRQLVFRIRTKMRILNGEHRRISTLFRNSWPHSRCTSCKILPCGRLSSGVRPDCVQGWYGWRVGSRGRCEQGFSLEESDEAALGFCLSALRHPSRPL